MPLVKIGPKHQVTIPKEVFEKLRLATGDFLDVQVTEQGILMVPQTLVPKDQAWFHTKEWQEKEREADEAIARGEVSEPFASVDKLMAHLEETPQRARKQARP
jgi:AbrB family looped-hinge helix DNA binding protein